MENLVNNYFTLRRFTEEINPNIVGGRIIDSFEQANGEQVINIINKGRAHFLTFFHANDITLISTAERRKPIKGTKPFFREIIGEVITDFQAFRFDRSCCLKFISNKTLVFKLYGRNYNVILHEGEEVINLYNPKQKNDLHKTLSSYQNSQFKNINELSKDIKTAIDNKSLNFENPKWKFIPESFFSQLLYFVTNVNKQYINYCLKNLLEPTFVVAQTKHNEKYIFTFKNISNKNEIIFESHSAIESLKYFYKLYIQYYQLEDERTKLLRNIRSELKNAFSKQQSNLLMLKKIERRTDYKHIGDLLMANLEKIPKSAPKVRLLNFYTGKTEEIKLNENLSIQKNAEKYYKKSKNQFREIKNVKVVLGKISSQIQDLRKKEAVIEEAATIKALRQHLKNETKKNKGNIDKNKFKKFQIDGYKVFVGKNASNNDELTFRFANKNDLWFHAQGIHGSHVILRNPKENILPKTIEKVSQLAAYYSKGRTSEFCPVVFTYKKYVRKLKGAPPGMVSYTNEKTLLVNPSIP